MQSSPNHQNNSTRPRLRLRRQPCFFMSLRQRLPCHGTKDATFPWAFGGSRGLSSSTLAPTRSAASSGATAGNLLRPSLARPVPTPRLNMVLSGPLVWRRRSAETQPSSEWRGRPADHRCRCGWNLVKHLVGQLNPVIDKLNVAGIDYTQGIYRDQHTRFPDRIIWAPKPIRGTRFFNWSLTRIRARNYTASPLATSS